MPVWPCSTIPLSAAWVFARCIGGGEELTFEQILIADNPPPARVPAAGRQVTDHHMHRRLDLLGLRRLEERAREGSRS